MYFDNSKDQIVRLDKSRIENAYVFIYRLKRITPKVSIFIIIRLRKAKCICSNKAGGVFTLKYCNCRLNVIYLA